MRYDVTVAPTVQAVTLVDLKARLRAAKVFDFDGDWEIVLAGAIDDIEKRLGRALTQRTYRGWMDAWPTNSAGCVPRELMLPMAPLISVTSVKTYAPDGTPTVFDPSNYVVDASSPSRPGRIVLVDGATWPDVSCGVGRAANAIEIVWISGPPAPVTVPPVIRNAIILLAQHRADGDPQSPEPRAVADLILNERPWVA